ncbi:MAG TPA: DUF1287 domain-containing protein [Dokdonella sp.]|uniref:DUF1287 domain-containing protein n=1 Tax=Dokdonella sp. TaxID=2291710 RepID=UPI002D802B37|nr:DUF1287 domain-containing protein [Dokdonella sp.]HET9033701.1 DUF1287 domain-containing protein [Dokdonella sp.]
MVLTLALLISGSAWARADIDGLLAAARAQVGVTTAYDPDYARLGYPGGDVPIDRGVCTDVIIRAMRGIDIDLQVEVHRDMRANFSSYPAIWGLKRPDSNIDHRRVPNLETWFARNGNSVPISSDAADYQPGDFVSWRLDGGLPHIGIVSAQRSADQLRPLIIHNIGSGARIEDVLFAWTIHGHYRWFASAPLFPQSAPNL